MTTTNPPPRGLLTIIEGLDRSGKSTQCQRLLTHLSILTPTRLQKFPDRTTPTGKLINGYLTNQTAQDDHAIHLLFSANRWESRASLLADLDAGTSIIVDRYSFSGAVYSAAKGKEGLGLEWAWAMEVGLPEPDLVVFLDLDPSVAEGRGGYGEERYETREMQRRVRELFGVVLTGLEGSGGRVVRVNAGQGVDEVEEDVWRAVKGVMAEVKRNGTPVGRLGKLGGLE